MTYICTKALNLSGQNYYPGDRIPADKIVVNRVRALKTNGYIADANEAGEASKQSVAADKIVVSVKSDDGKTFPVDLTAESANLVFDIFQSTADEAVEKLDGCKDESALIIIHAVDARKSVQKAALKAADVLLNNEADKQSSSSYNEATEVTE